MQEPRAPSTVESRYLEQPREKQKSSRKQGFEIIHQMQCQITKMIIIKRNDDPLIQLLLKLLNSLKCYKNSF